MGTSATIIFKDEDNEIFYVNRGGDGFPDVVLPDLQEVVDAKKNSWSGSEIGLLVSSFLGWHFDKGERLPDYMMASCVRGDDSYQYYVVYNDDTKEWEISYGDIPYKRKAIEELENGTPIVCQKCFTEAEYDELDGYHCPYCGEFLVVSQDDFEFKINGEYSNIVFKQLT